MFDLEYVNETIIMRTILILAVGLTLFQHIQHGECIRCFECDNVPNPISCGDITTCEASQSCFIEQVITTSGNVIYNSGCESKSRCTALNGRRSFTKRNSDIVTCRECCDGPFCNNKGCGNPGIARPQRGVYCYNCPYLSDPSACESVAICKSGEKCLTSIRSEFFGLQGAPVYSSECESTNVCQHLPSSGNGECCDSDFCNNYFNATNPFHPPTAPPPVLVTDTTNGPQTAHFASTIASVTSQPVHDNHCDNSGGYQRLFLSKNVEFCIKVFEGDPKNWLGAKIACESDNARLVVTNTMDKINALKNYLQMFWRLRDRHNFWIGLWDRDSINKFYWINNDELRATSWGNKPQQPTYVYRGKDEDCVYIFTGDHGWHDTWCEHEEAYICEKL